MNGTDILDYATATSDIQETEEGSKYRTTIISVPNTCLLCNEVYTTRELLRAHCEYSHTHEYHCVLCMASYPSVTTLLIHSAEHASRRIKT